MSADIFSQCTAREDGVDGYGGQQYGAKRRRNDVLGEGSFVIWGAAASGQQQAKASLDCVLSQREGGDVQDSWRARNGQYCEVHRDVFCRDQCIPPPTPQREVFLDMDIVKTCCSYVSRVYDSRLLILIFDRRTKEWIRFEVPFRGIQRGK